MTRFELATSTLSIDVEQSVALVSAT